MTSRSPARDASRKTAKTADFPPPEPAASIPSKPAQTLPPMPSVAPAVYRARPEELHALLAAAIFALGSSLAACAFGLWGWYFALSTYGPAAVPRWTTVWLVAAPPLGLAGMVCLARFWHLARGWVEASPDGLRVHRGRRSEWIPWDAIREIRALPSRRPGTPFAALELRLANARRLRLTRSLADLEGLIQQIKRSAYPLLQDRLRTQFNRGEALDFGPLRLTPEGVQAGRKSIQWGRLQSMDVRAGQLNLLAHPPERTRIRVSAARVPNIDVCVQIIRLLGPRP